MLHPRDHRAVFAIPWEGVSIFGTTDVDHGELGWEKEPAMRIAISKASGGYLYLESFWPNEATHRP